MVAKANFQSGAGLTSSAPPSSSKFGRRTSRMASAALMVRDEEKKMPRYKMVLTSTGNPDFGQYAPISDPLTVIDDSLVAMREACARYINEWDLGGGNWDSPVVYDGDKAIGYFSYNLRLWVGKPGMRPQDRREILIEGHDRAIGLMHGQTS